MTCFVCNQMAIDAVKNAPAASWLCRCRLPCREEGEAGHGLTLNKYQINSDDEEEEQQEAYAPSDEG